VQVDSRFLLAVRSKALKVGLKNLRRVNELRHFQRGRLFELLKRPKALAEFLDSLC
jgi:hypothetical protein